MITENQMYRYAFWSCFITYCSVKGRQTHICINPPSTELWYNIPIGKKGYHITLHALHGGVLRAGLYFYGVDRYSDYYRQRVRLDDALGFPLEWPSQPEPAAGMKKIMIGYSTTGDIQNLKLFPQQFEWLIAQHDLLRVAVQVIDP